MVLIDDFATLRAAIESSPDCAKALALRGISDVKKVMATPLTVGYCDAMFDGVFAENGTIGIDAGGTHPIATGANFAKDEWINHRLSFMDRQLWMPRYNPDERFPEGKYPNRSASDTGLGQLSADDPAIVDTDNVVWLTTGTTHIARAEEWPIMPPEWVHALLKPWNFFDETPTLGLNAPAKTKK